MEKDYARSHLSGDVSGLKVGIGYMVNSDLYGKDRQFRSLVDKCNAAIQELDTHVSSCLETKK